MSENDESENKLDRFTARGWRVLSNQNHGPNPKAGKLKTLIQDIRGRQRVPGQRKIDETDRPEAA